MAKILVVDDDKLLTDMISDCLSAEHHVVECSLNGDDARERMQNYHYDVIILDWGLPGISGLELCKKFRFDGGTTPILMLTGRDTISEKESGLDSGADDYLTKPFHMKELSARIRALLRRIHPAKSNVLVAKNIALDPAIHRVTRDGAEVQLHPKEFALLEHFMRNPNQVFSAQSLLDRVWTSESNVGPETVRTCIKRLRQKIDVDGQASLIENVYGVGYKLTLE
ncbi:MAG TPA: response regulator transcription factor [Candidatus Obscuribacterales bacterium]